MKKLFLTSLLLSSSTVMASPFVVKDIRVDGATPGTESSIISALPIHVGQRVTDRDLADIVRQLFTEGRFKNVEAVRDGNTLVVRVFERGIINKIDIKGDKQIPKEALLANLKDNKLSKGDFINTDKLNAFVAELTKYYHSIGYNNAVITPKIKQLDNNLVDVTLDIKENEITLVKQMKFEGNKSFSRGKLLEQLTLQPDVSWWNLLESSRFSQQKLQEDLSKLQTFYLDRGYAKFRIIDTDLKYSDDKKDVAVTIKLDEGDKYTVSGVRILGDTGGMKPELERYLSVITPGQLFRGNILQDIEQKMTAKLGDYGFAQAKVVTSPTFDDKNHSVLLNIIVETGRRLYVREINFSGNSGTEDSTLRQEMRQQEGSWYSSSDIALGKQRLERTGFFKNVNVETKTVQGSDDLVDVDYIIAERNTGSLNFGVGYGTESGLTYQVGIKQDNFLGMGSSIGISGTKNNYTTDVSLNYSEPYFTKDGVSLSSNIFYNDYNNSDSTTAASYAKTSYGLGATLGFPVDETSSFYTGLGYTHNKLSNLTPEYNRALYLESMNVDTWGITTDDFTLRAGWNYSDLNRGYLPTKGISAQFGGKVTLPGSDNSFYKLHAEAAGYYPLDYNNRWVISAHGSLDYGSGIGGKDLPFYENFSAGGIGSLRGFSYGSVGPNAIYNSDGTNSCTQQPLSTVSTNPGDYCYINYDVVGGNAMATASLEFIVPTPFLADKYQDNVRSMFFVDAASVWNTKWSSREKEAFKNVNGIADYGDPSRVRVSAGVTFQWNSPIGPLVLSYGIPIKKYEGDQTEPFQFSIGGTF